ncbi:hypothetical protein SLA2020_147730 [Shorea laevis]
MKGVKGKLLKKLKSIKPVGYLKPDRVLQVFAIDGFVDSCPKTPDPRKEPLMARKEFGPEINRENRVVIQEPEIIDVTELMRDLEDDEEEEEEMGSDEGVEDKENIRPLLKGNIAVLGEENLGVPMTVEQGSCRKTENPLSEIDISSFRRPDLNSCSLFDPNLLVAFEQAVKEHMKVSEAERQARIEQEKLQQSGDETECNAKLEQENEPPHKTRRIDAVETIEDDPILVFEEKCPPGGDGSVILYTTTLTGIRKTFEDCNRVRFLLESFRVLFFERDVSMHMEYKEELWKILDGKAVPPKLFIKGRYIGGAEEVLTLHEQGKLKLLFDGIPVGRSDGPCEACAGVRFVLCFGCSGSHRIIADDGLSSQCPTCNENGLIICPHCC